MADHDARTVVDDLIDEWHRRDTKLSLTTWLGVSREDYAAWVEGRMPYEEFEIRIPRLRQYPARVAMPQQEASK